jgi:hypothetical protein
MSNRGTAAVEAAMMASATIAACRTGGNDAPNAAERSSAAPSKTLSSSASSSPPSGGTSKDESLPDPSLDQSGRCRRDLPAEQGGDRLHLRPSPGCRPDYWPMGRRSFTTLPMPWPTPTRTSWGPNREEGSVQRRYGRPRPCYGSGPTFRHAVVHFSAMPKVTGAYCLATRAPQSRR